VHRHQKKQSTNALLFLARITHRRVEAWPPDWDDGIDSADIPSMLDVVKPPQKVRKRRLVLFAQSRLAGEKDACFLRCHFRLEQHRPVWQIKPLSCQQQTGTD
jgi:hypothetical protein